MPAGRLVHLGEAGVRALKCGAEERAPPVAGGGRWSAVGQDQYDLGIGAGLLSRYCWARDQRGRAQVWVPMKCPSRSAARLNRCSSGAELEKLITCIESCRTRRAPAACSARRRCSAAPRCPQAASSRTGRATSRGTAAAAARRSAHLENRRPRSRTAPGLVAGVGGRGRRSAPGRAAARRGPWPGRRSLAVAELRGPGGRVTPCPCPRRRGPGTRLGETGQDLAQGVPPSWRTALGPVPAPGCSSTPAAPVDVAAGSASMSSTGPDG